jgi:4-amino-4-deoxy-L-arabinose transferase-like glycosyltransferase
MRATQKSGNLSGKRLLMYGISSAIDRRLIFYLTLLFPLLAMLWFDYFLLSILSVIPLMVFYFLIEKSRTSTFAMLLFIFLLGFFLRITIFPEITFAIGDPPNYLNLAKNLASGKGYTSDFVYIFWSPFMKEVPHPETFKPPLFPLLIALSNIVTGFDFFTCAKGISLLFGLATILLTFILGQKINEGLGILSSYFVAIHPMAVNFSALAYTEATFTFIVVVFFFLLFYLKKRSEFANLKIWWVLGMVVGLSYLTRFSLGLILLPIPILYFAFGFVYQKPKVKIVCTCISIYFFSFIISILPFLLWRQIEFGNFFYSDFHSQILFSTGLSVEELIGATEIPSTNLVNLLAQSDVVLDHTIDGLLTAFGFFGL